MRLSTVRRFELLLPLALYAFLLWRMPYSLKHYPLRVLDWVVPVLGLGIWAVVRWRRREPWPRTILDWPVLAWCAVLTWAAAFSVNPRVSWHGAWEAWIGALILWLLVDAIRRGWGRPLWQAILLIASVVCLLAATELLAWYFGIPLLPQFQQGWLPIGGLISPLPPATHRLGMALVNITALSAFIALVIPSAVCSALSSRKRDVRWGMLLWLVAAGGVELASSSRGGFLAIGVSLPFVLVGSLGSPGVRRWWSRFSSGRMRILLAGVLVVALAAAVALGFTLATRLNSAGHRSGDAVRLDLWRSAVAMTHDHPLTGVGTAAYGTALRTYRDPLQARDHIVTAHNLYLNTGAEAGIPGLFAGAWLLVALAWTWWKRWRSTPAGAAPWWQLLGMGAGLAGLAAQSVVDTFTEPAIVLVASFFIAQTAAVAPDRPAAAHGIRSKPWPWLATILFLVLSTAGLAWESVGGAGFARSLAATAQDQIEEAAVAAEQAREHDPAVLLYACHTGYLYGRLAAEGQSEMLQIAVESYRECLAQPATRGWVDHLNLAALLWTTGQQTEARAAVAAATAQTPLEWMPWLNRGYWAELQGDQTDAVRSYGWVLARDPELAGSPFWRQDGQRAEWWDEIVAAGSEAASQLGTEPAYWRWQVALAADQTDAEATTREVEAWLQLHPADTEALAWMGEALAEQGQPEEALSWLDRALAAEPARARSHLARGETALALGRFAEAERDLRTALFLEPSPRIHLGLARLAMASEDVPLALTEYSQALRGLNMVHSYDLVLYRWMGWPVPLPQVLQIGYRFDGQAALEWGALLEQQGNLDVAQQVYKAALDLDPFLDEVRERLLLAPGDGG